MCGGTDPCQQAEAYTLTSFGQRDGVYSPEITAMMREATRPGRENVGMSSLLIRYDLDLD